MMHVFVINLGSDTERRVAISRQLDRFVDLAIEFVSGVETKSWPRTVLERLGFEGAGPIARGTLGCFLGHLAAWERIARLGATTFSLVLEDDVTDLRLDEIRHLRTPADAHLIFVNDRLCLEDGELPSRPCTMVESLRRIDRTESHPGADGYLLSPEGARKLVSAVRRDLYFGHVDGRLLRYCVDMQDIESLGPESRMATVIRTHHDGRYVPSMGILKGYGLSRPMVRHAGLASTREQNDLQGEPSPGA